MEKCFAVGESVNRAVIDIVFHQFVVAADRSWAGVSQNRTFLKFVRRFQKRFWTRKKPRLIRLEQRLERKGSTFHKCTYLSRNDSHWLNT